MKGLTLRKSENIRLLEGSEPHVDGFHGDDLVRRLGVFCFDGSEVVHFIRPGNVAFDGGIDSAVYNRSILAGEDGEATNCS